MGDDLEIRLMRSAAAYARCIDNGELTDWPTFFAERCFYRITTADNHRRGLEAGIVWADSRAMLIDRVASLREANIYEQHCYRHLLGLPTVLAVLGTEVESETPFAVMRTTRGQRTDVFATGRYLDRHRMSDGGMEIERRDVVCDSSVFDTLLALPL